MIQKSNQKVLSLLMLLMLALTGSMEVKGQETSDFHFNSGVRYSQWVTKSRMNSFYRNTTADGFAVYDAEGNKVKNGNTKFDYVPGLVAKAIVENVQYYSQYQWAQSWTLPFFYSMADYCNTYYGSAPTSGGSLDNLNATKMFFGLYELTKTGGAYASKSIASSTKSNAQTALTRAMSGFADHNTKYIISNETPAYAAGHTIVEGGWYHKSTYKDEMWLDGSYMGPALFAQLRNYKGSDIIVSDWTIVYRQIQALWEMCWNPTDKLLYHAFAAKGYEDYSNTWAGFNPTGGVYHSASYWGRACGWYLLALVDILEQMDKAGLSGTTEYSTLKGHLSDFCEGLAARQDATSGCWYQLLDEDGTFSANSYSGKSFSTTDNYLESSASALFAAGFMKAIRLGYISSATYESVAKKAYEGLVNTFFAADGNEGVHLFGSCRSAGLGGTNKNMPRDGSKAYYLLGGDVARVAKSENVTEGKILGAFILAATEYERLYQDNTVLFEKDLAPSYELEVGDEISCPATGSGANITYQWYKDGVAVEGATNSTIAPTASGAYYCKATSGTTTITSSTAQVTVAGDDTFTPEFTTNLPATATATEGVAKTLTVAADHVESYQWYSNTTASNTGGQAISGATSASYTFTPATAGTLYYYCVATNSKATGTQSVASAVCTVTVSEAPEMWTAAGATYNSTSKGYEVEGRGTYYKATSGGTAEDSEDNTATWAAGTYRLKTSNNLFIYSLASSVSGLKVYMRGSGNRTLSSVATASSLNGSYSTLTNNTDYTYSSTCTSDSYITTSDTRDVVTFTFTSALAAGTVVQITLSGNAYIYGIEPVIASQKTENTLALSTESGEVTVGNTLDIKGYINNKNNTETEVTYTSNNTSVATVENGVITGVAEGEATITVAQAETEEYTAGSATFTITVTATPTTNYIVTFYNGNTFYGSLTIDEGKTVTAPAISPTKQGYTFKGWALENGSTARVLFPYEVWSDVNFYAVWSEDTGGGSGEDVEIFSAVPTENLSVPGNTNDLEITSTNATIKGGKLYATNVNSSNKNMIQNQGSRKSFGIMDDGSYFKIVLSDGEKLEAGDKICAFYYFSGSNTKKSLWLSKDSRPSSEPAEILTATPSTSGWHELSTYTVTENDGICGKTTLYIYRASGNGNTYFTDFTITREGQAVGNDITLDATTDYENFDSYVGTNKNVTLKRSFTEGKWTTLVLPFSVTTEQLVAAFDYAGDCELAKIRSMSVAQGKGSIHYTTVSSIEANKPVLAKIKPNESGKYVFNGVTVVAPTSIVSTSTDGKVEMHGVYETTGYTQISSDSYFLSGGKFYDWSYLSNMSPFSAYLLPVGENKPSSLSISMEETGIENVNANVNVNANENESYNLAGQRVTKEYNGIVIIKGKKVFTK